jgi:hypothetical protein
MGPDHEERAEILWSCGIWKVGLRLCMRAKLKREVVRSYYEPYGIWRHVPRRRYVFDSGARMSQLLLRMAQDCVSGLLAIKALPTREI